MNGVPCSVAIFRLGDFFYPLKSTKFRSLRDRALIPLEWHGPTGGGVVFRAYDSDRL